MVTSTVPRLLGVDIHDELDVSHGILGFVQLFRHEPEEFPVERFLSVFAVAGPVEESFLAPETFVDPDEVVPDLFIIDSGGSCLLGGRFVHGYSIGIVPWGMSTIRGIDKSIYCR